jgi:hypothetical protein
MQRYFLAKSIMPLRGDAIGSLFYIKAARMQIDAAINVSY